MEERCPACDKELSTVDSCQDCAYEHDATEPDSNKALDFSTEEGRVYEPDFFDGVYDEVHLLEEMSHE